MTATPPADYRQHLEVETPEHVILDYEIAGIGTRTLAALADWGIVAALMLLSVMAMIFFVGMSGWFAAVELLLMYALFTGYFALFEGLRHGQTPGKRWLGIRVIRDTGHGVTLSEAAVRNLLLPIDLFAAIGAILIAAHPRGKRLGDMVAGTVVVRDQPAAYATGPAASDAPAREAANLGTPELTDAEFQLLRGFDLRAPTLPPAVRDRFAAQLAARVARYRSGRHAGDLAFLAALYQEELARRQGRFGARSAARRGGPARSSVAEQLVARKRARWDEFQSLTERTAAHGLDALRADELADFATRYREVAADLARARTYRADPAVVARLERLVAAGHNVLYRGDRQTWRRLWRFIARECPREVVTSWRYVALALLVFSAPAAAGYALLRDRPALAPALIPDVMLERAEAASARTARGEGYVDAAKTARPLMATEIITNNVHVAFTCFASGIVLGIGSLVALAYNGLVLGAVSGYFADMGVLGYLWTFVVGHGLLELFSIWVAGAAGFLLGRAIIAPGSLPRKDALVLAGRRAIRLLGAVVVLLLIAGSIEGFISSSAAPLAGRVAVSGGSFVLLLLYLLNGARSGPRGGDTPTGTSTRERSLYQ